MSLLLSRNARKLVDCIAARGDCRIGGGTVLMKFPDITAKVHTNERIVKSGFVRDMAHA